MYLVLWVDNDDIGGLGEPYLQVKRAVKAHGGEILVITSVESARDELRKREVNRLILDLHFGDGAQALSGLDLFKELRSGAFEPLNSRSIRVTLYSNYAALVKGLIDIENDPNLEVITKLARGRDGAEEHSYDFIGLVLWKDS